MNFKGKKILITGGTGSLGKALLERIQDAKEIRVLSRSEAGQLPLRDKYPQVKFILGDVADYPAVEDAVRGVDIVIHAAGFKFLNLAEEQPRQCVMTNIVGSLNVIEAVKEDGGVEICIGISTDKSVYARNVYGATKHIMEKLFKEANRHSETKFCCARYGNVLGTTGSVLTIWEKQVDEGKPLTVTDPAMNRFFFSLNEAVELIFYALSHTEGGEVFVRKMPAFNIMKLAEGYNTQIQITGLRPGEKLDEVLIGDYEGEEYTTKNATDSQEIVVLK